MEKPKNTLDDLWKLTTSVAVINYILTVIYLLYFLSVDREVTENIKVGIVIAILTLSVVLTYSSRQVQKKLKICENIFQEDEMKAGPNIDSSKFKTEVEETNNFSNLKILSRFFGKSNVRRFSLPMQSQGEVCYHCNRPTLRKNGFAFESHPLLKTNPDTSKSTNSDGMYCKDCHNIPVLLHNFKKDLDDIIERVKLLNEVYTDTDGDEEDAKQNSTTSFQKTNSDGVFVGSEKYHKSKLHSVSDTQKIHDSYTQKVHDCLENACSFQPYQFNQDLDISKKPIQKRKIDLSNQCPESVGVNKLLIKNIPSYNRIFSGNNIEEAFSNSCIIDTEEGEPSQFNIPSHYSQFRSPINPLSSHYSQFRSSINPLSSHYSQFRSSINPLSSHYSQFRSPINPLSSHYSQFCSPINLLSARNIGKKKISLEFCKTSVSRIINAKSSLKNPLRRIPMKPHMLSIPMRQYVQANTKKRQLAIMSKKTTISKHYLKIFKISTALKNSPIIQRNAPIVSRNALRISKNALVISRNASMVRRNRSVISSKLPVSENVPPVSVKGPISVDEILISMKNNLLTNMNEQLISINNILISKFDLLDTLNFADVFYYMADYYDLYPNCNIHNDCEQVEYNTEDY